MINRVIVFGDALYSIGIVNALRESGAIAGVDTEMLKEPLADDGSVDAEVVIVCAGDGEVAVADAIVRRIARRSRSSRIIMVTNLPWEDRLDRISERNAIACIDMSIPRDHLLQVVALAAAGFCII